MNPRPLVLCRTLAASGVLVACYALCLTGSTSATAATRCEALREWASAYAGATPTLEEIAGFDRSQRIAIFNAVSPDVRAGLWREQLTRFSRQPDLSSTQRALIAEAIEHATPQLYQPEPAAQQAFRRFWPRAEAAFTSNAHKRMWGDLGAVVPAAERVVPSAADLPADQASEGAFGLACGCSTFDPAFQCGTANCNWGGCSESAGCGQMGNLKCNGRCS